MCSGSPPIHVCMWVFFHIQSAQSPVAPFSKPTLSRDREADSENCRPLCFLCSQNEHHPELPEGPSLGFPLSLRSTRLSKALRRWTAPSWALAPGLTLTLEAAARLHPPSSYETSGLALPPPTARRIPPLLVAPWEPGLCLMAASEAGCNRETSGSSLEVPGGGRSEERLPRRRLQQCQLENNLADRMLSGD